MMYLDKNGNYIPWVQPDYGYDAEDKPVVPEKGWFLVARGNKILAGDKPFDVYKGWIKVDGWHARTGHVACSDGRWTAWERKKQTKTQKMRKTLQTLKSQIMIMYDKQHLCYTDKECLLNIINSAFSDLKEK